MSEPVNAATQVNAVVFPDCGVPVTRAIPHLPFLSNSSWEWSDMTPAPKSIITVGYISGCLKMNYFLAAQKSDPKISAKLYCDTIAREGTFSIFRHCMLKFLEVLCRFCRRISLKNKNFRTLPKILLEKKSVT